MRAYVDEVTLRSAPGRGTRVVLDKRIHWEAALPALTLLPRSRRAFGSRSESARRCCSE